MEALGLVLFKSAAWLTGFALVYLLVLSNERYFRLNRLYLLTGIAASLLFPFYTFHYTVVIPSIQTGSATMADELIPGVVIPEETTLPFYFWIYLAGITVVLLRLLFQTWKIIRKLKETGYEQTGSVKLVRTSDYASSFSFFSYVFVNPSTATSEMEVIMNHEREHIQQRHWLDLLLVELICIVQWFNPFAWIYVHLVRQNHEYLADEQALQRTVDPVIYQAALLNQLLGAPVFSLTNSFSYSLNKKRFSMMKKKIESPFRKLKILVVLPLAAMIFYAFAAPEYQYGKENNSVAPEGKTMSVKGQVLKADGTTPLPGTSVILRGSTIGTITDQDGNFLLKGIPADGELVFSFVGFQTVVRKASNQPMKIVMEVEKIGIDQITVVGYGTPPPPPPPPPPLALSLRGIDNANPPLFVLDGIPITKAFFDKINPETIESISVLKDKSATDVYGERAKNGAILIKTKAHSINEQENANLRLFVIDGVPVDAKTFKISDLKDNVLLNLLDGESASKLYGEKGKNGAFIMTSKEKYFNSQLFLLDGKAISKSEMDLLGPDQIESIGILKGKSATDTYGEKAKNGVILIKSKSATGQKSGQANDVQKSSDDVFVIVEEMPEFPGKELALRDFIGRTIKYPEDAIKDSIQGKVFVTFVVKSDGTIANAKIARGVHPLLDNEAIRVVNLLPRWTPGKQAGVAVNVSYTVPVAFSLDGGKAKQKASFVAPKTPQKGEKQVFIVVEEMPEFPGGYIALRSFIAKAIKYPGEAQKDKIQGKVLVSFVINSDGKVEQAKIERSVNPALDAEAIRVVNLMPDWKPGKQRGTAVSVAYTIPIEFKVQ